MPLLLLIQYWYYNLEAGSNRNRTQAHSETPLADFH